MGLRSAGYQDSAAFAGRVQAVDYGRQKSSRPLPGNVLAWETERLQRC